MSYSTNQEVVDYIGSTVLQQYQDASTVNEGLLRDSRARAAALIDSYVSVQAETPVITAFDDALAARLRDVELAIVRYYEASRGDAPDVSELIKRGYDDAIEWLEKVATGKVSLKCLDRGDSFYSVELRRGDEAEVIEREIIEFQIDSASRAAELQDTGDRTGKLFDRSGMIKRVCYRAKPIAIVQPEDPDDPPVAESVTIAFQLDGQDQADLSMVLSESVCKGFVSDAGLSFDAGQTLAVVLTIDEGTQLPTGISGRVWVEVQYDAAV